MKLQEIFDQLAYGELSQLGLINETTGLLEPAKYRQLLSYVNLGLTTLHKRFTLKEGRVTISLQSGQTVYPLLASGDVTLIAEGGEDFNDDILKIERVLTSSGAELDLNNESNPLSCFTPKLNTLRVPTAIVEQSMDLSADLITSVLVVVYRANHPVIPLASTINPARIEIDLPYSHVEPLLLYVASRATTPLGTGQFEGLAGNNYYARYEKACQDLEIQNLQVDQGNQNTRLQSKGWV